MCITWDKQVIYVVICKGVFSVVLLWKTNICQMPINTNVNIHILFWIGWWFLPLEIFEIFILYITYDFWRPFKRSDFFLHHCLTVVGSMTQGSNCCPLKIFWMRGLSLMHAFMVFGAITPSSPPVSRGRKERKHRSQKECAASVCPPRLESLARWHTDEAFLAWNSPVPFCMNWTEPNWSWEFLTLILCKKKYSEMALKISNGFYLSS